MNIALALPRSGVMSRVCMLRIIALVIFNLAVLAMEPAGYWVEAVVTAYSPHDEIDSDYHMTKGVDRWKTASMVDVRYEPYGIAVPHDGRGRPRIPYGSRIYVPMGEGYLDKSREGDRWFTADDTGGIITSRTLSTGVLHIDLRYRTEHSAKVFGRKRMQVFIAKL